MDITINKVNETHVRIDAEPSICMELHDFFAFTVPGHRFTPAYKIGKWNGKIYLFNLSTKQIYLGLISKILAFAKEFGYSVDGYLGPDVIRTDTAKITSWTGSLDLRGTVPRDYQIAALEAAINSGGRSLIISPTGSGKTWIAYLLYRWYSKKTLVIVPTVGLCSQSSQDFIDYGCPDNIQVINEGKSTDITCNLVFATWQSIFRMPKEWFRQFEMVIGDECHLFAAKSLVSIMEKLDQCPLKFGMTGTLDDSKINGMILEGLFGPVFRTTTTAELIEKKVLSNFRIECLSITYPEMEKKFCKEFTYAEELDYIVTHPKRNKLICNLTQKLKGNTIVLFQFVEKHGKELYEMIKKSTNRPVYYISGEVKGEERERLRKLIETQNDVILVASVGTSSVGLNLISLTNIVFASPSKSKIRTLQSIGRVLRRSKTKTNAVLWDISDDLCWKSRKNYTFRHFMERVKIYAREQFDYKLHKINL